ncbi:MAG: hypothetical protein ACU0DW_11995 [Shimia sp.]
MTSFTLTHTLLIACLIGAWSAWYGWRPALIALGVVLTLQIAPFAFLVAITDFSDPGAGWISFLPLVMIYITVPFVAAQAVGLMAGWAWRRWRQTP